MDATQARYQKIFHEKDSELNATLIFFFLCQWSEMKEYDWCTLVKQDLTDLELPRDLSEIQRLSTFGSVLVKEF